MFVDDIDGTNFLLDFSEIISNDICKVIKDVFMIPKTAGASDVMRHRVF